ncbi:MAG: alpha/beta hydrolase [Candidatus Sedimenticola sp. PURPLELP]
MPDQPRYLDTDQHRKIAYHHLDGSRPGVIFLAGFMSDMTGTKALALESWCHQRGTAFTRFDYSGHGASSGTFESGSIGDWLEDAISVLDKVTRGPQIVVGSSMGGWISLLLAMKRSHRVAALVTIACATDFTERLLRPALTTEQLQSLESKGVAELPSHYNEQPYRIGRRLIDEGVDHCLLDGSIPIDCPVRMLHGMEDRDVPWEISRMTLERLDSNNTGLVLLENGDHRLSKPEEMERLFLILDSLIIPLTPPDQAG